MEYRNAYGFWWNTRRDYYEKRIPMAKARKVLKNEVIAVIGYGVQGPAKV
jgi:ketol-acid reductoisomerase